MSTINTATVVARMDIDDFLAIEDEELKKYIYLNRRIGKRTKKQKVDSEEKVAYYEFDVDIRINSAGKFYKHTVLMNWIVYNKSSKKVKVSRNAYNSCFNDLLGDYFQDVNYTKLFVRGCSATLCKRIIEGKMKTVRDFMQYQKSYYVKRKEVSVEDVYRFYIRQSADLLHIIEDPENVTNEMLSKIENGELNMINPEIRRGKVFKFKSTDLTKVNELYEEWTRKQSEKYASFIGQGAKEDGDIIIEGTFYKGKTIGV